MKPSALKVLSLLLLISFCIPLDAQKKKTQTAKQASVKNPTTFVISKTDFDQLFAHKGNELIASKTNKYLDKSTVQMNTVNGDTKFMKIKLAYFPKSYLMIQVNGDYSTQVFVLSDDKSVFYKGKMDKGTVTMTKCNEDDIVSE